MSGAAPPPPAPRRAIRLRAKLIVLGLSLLVSLLLAEGAYRIFLTLRYRRATANWNHELYVLHGGDPIVYTLRPRAHGAIKLEKQPGATWTYQLNSRGLRGPEPARKKNPAVKRILLLGDSYAFGWGLNREEDAFPRRFEHLLNEDSPTTRAEIINAGVPGYNTVMEERALRRWYGTLKPDAVILTYITNDAEPQATVPMRPDQVYHFSYSWLLTAAGDTINRLAFGGRRVFPVEFNSPDSHFNYLKSFAPWSRKWRESRAALDRIAEYCRKKKIPLFVFMLPDFSQPLGEDYYYAKIHSTVDSWCKELSIPHSDLLGAFQGKDHLERIIDPKHWPEGENHPNALAHGELAAAMNRVLREHNFLGLK